MRFFPLILISICLASCVTTQRPLKPSPKSTAAPSQPKATPPIAKAGQKTPAEAPLVTSPQPSLSVVFARLNDLAQALSDEDIHIASSLHPAPQASLEEAVLVVAQLRLLKQQIDQSRSFQSRDLYTTGQEAVVQTQKSTASLERLFQDLQIDLLKTFQSNATLKNVSSLKLVQELGARTSNSAGFDAALQAYLEQESQNWVELRTAAPPIAANPSPTPTETSQIGAAPATDLPQTPTGEGKPAPTDLKRSDAILMQAQKLADKGDFKQAIEFATRIDAQDLLYDQAREKIRVFSNRAIQDLRQKAALAFQNALPMSDSRAKQAYLIQARDLLERALQDYPSGDQLETVKENLAVIKRDLDSIAKETAVDSAAKTQ